MSRSPDIAIVDFGLGNLFSIRNACSKVGLRADIAKTAKEIRRADAVILPGVGAFADAMAELHRSDMVDSLGDVVKAGKPLLGICLGMQLLMSESSEYGLTPGLNFIPGVVRQFDSSLRKALPVPQISWNCLQPAHSQHENPVSWRGTILHGVAEKDFMYFVHSFYVEPQNQDNALAFTNYGSLSYCSVVASGNIIGCQFHPERSGPAGLMIYANWARMIAGDKSFKSAEGIALGQRLAG